MEERIVTKTQKGEDVQVQTKMMLIAFFDILGVVQAEFLPQDLTVNQHVYKNILRRLMRSVREKKTKGNEVMAASSGDAPAEGEKNCGKRGHGCFIMTMLWEFGSFLPKITLLY